MCDDEHDDLRDDDVMWRMPCARFVDKDKGKCRLPCTPQTWKTCNFARV